MSPRLPLRGVSASAKNDTNRRQEQQRVQTGHTEFEVTK